MASPYRLGVAALTLALGCTEAPRATPTPDPSPTPATASAAMVTQADPSASTAAPTAAGTRGEVILVVLGPRFPPDILRSIEQSLRTQLQVDVTVEPRVHLPRSAYYAPRKRYRADKLLDHLLETHPDLPPSTRVLGLTTRDISTTKGKHYDWGIFGLGLVPGQAAVVSMHRLLRGAKGREHLRFRVANTAVHEVGHTFGLDHCPEDRCPMADAQGGIKSTDRSRGHLGPGCQAKLDEAFPVRPVSASASP